ncbi:hypothetical protein [Tenacibaculum sp. MAR_2009_124]|uniref:hypothetical protein n=1 Tax=Tenacibaculum sp. MAR_2009_124 TaxID=1250059 RepID=UPI00115F7D23|nr:hypothetical protein [Tenacibaculum sp. MAR_2009_124]
MKKLFITLILISNFSFAQDLVNDHWSIDKIIGQNLNDINSYILTQIDINKGSEGHRIYFEKNGTFSCYYSAQCGNDCFSQSTGTYEIVDKEHLKLFVKKFQQFGFCKSETLKLNHDLGIYFAIKISDTEIKLERVPHTN